MRIVIDIQDSVLNDLDNMKNSCTVREIVKRAIENGAILPKGCGRLIDADKAIADYANYGISHCWDATDLPEIMAECPTIIEADKEV